MADLIDECGKDLAAYGYKIEKLGKYKAEIARLHIKTAKQASDVGFDRGDYVILSSPIVYQLGEDCHNFLAAALQDSLQQMIDGLDLNVRQNKFLIIGVGNPDILADSLGKKVLEKIEIDPFGENNHVFKLCPNIYLNTGISTNEIVHIMAVALGVDCVILIDSLATKCLSRLGVSFQLNSAGLTPGSALNSQNKRIDKDSLGIACLSFGVPFMIFAKDICKSGSDELILAPKDISENVDIAAKIIASAISGALKIK